MGRPKKYKTEEERLEAIRESKRKWREANKERIAEYNKQYCQINKKKILEYQKQYHQDNKERIAEYKKQYYKTPMVRAAYLVSSYKQADKEMNRGECTLTAKWIINNIFTKKCIYCGESDWQKLGCDRKDNSKPHIEDNVVCCCGDCNNKRQKKPFQEFIAECKQKNLEDIATS